MEREPYSRKSNGSRSYTSRSSGSSSVSLSLAKKKEQLALDQLKTKQTLREQELKRKMSELQYAKEFMEAQMEEERATVSFNVYEEFEGQGIRLAELVTDGASLGGPAPLKSDVTNHWCWRSARELAQNESGKTCLLFVVVITEYELVWRCTKFKNQSHQDKRKVVKEQNLCLKCLQIGHFTRTCPKPRFRCQEEGCNKDHKTLTHPPSAGLSDAGVSQSRSNQEGTEVNVSRDMGGMASDGATVTAVTGAGERVCLSVVLVKVLVKDSSLMPVNTYALLDSGYVLSDSLP